MSEILLRAAVGDFAAVDFGGSGPDVLLVHDAATNLEALRPLGERLRSFSRPVAIDIRGHGQTLLPLEAQDQPQRDLGPICAALGMTEPLLVGEGATAWVVASAVLRGFVSCRGLVLLSAHPFARPAAVNQTVLQQLASSEVLQALAARNHLGQRIPVAKRQEFLAQAAAAQQGDWLVGTVPADLWQALLDRALVPHGDGMLVRQPTLDVLRRLVSIGPHLDPFPSAEGLDGLTVPVLFIDPEGGVSPSDEAAVQAVAAAAPNRHAIAVKGVGYLGVAAAPAVAPAIKAMLTDTNWPADL